jgi:hypothetical protein
MAEQGEGFVFVDKRGTAGDGARAPVADDGRAGAEFAPTEGFDEDPGEEHPRLAARDRLLMCLDILHQGAWIAMGLVADPVTQEVEKDLDEARILIDSAAELATRVEPMVDDSIRRELRTMVANLRMNFVNQSKR